MRDSRPTEASVTIHAELCKGCCLCVQACPQDVLQQGQALNRRGYYFIYYLGQGCTGCGLCFYSCPEPGAVTVYRKGKRS